MKRKGRAFAKINLFLYVISKRTNGYHNLCSLMTRIDLWDDIQMTFPDKGGISVTCDYPGVPEDASNLACKAAEVFFNSLGPGLSPKERGVSIRIIKRIPPGGGLGGGSSNAATVLNLLNQQYGMPFSTPELIRMGLSLGADVPFFLFGEPAMAGGVGEKLEKIPKLKPYHLILCDPGVAASTAEVYKNIDFRLTSNQNYNKKSGLIVSMRDEEVDIRNHLHNDLEEPACRLYPEIRETKEEMALLLQRNVYMTGSGSSLFVLFSTRRAAEKEGERLERIFAGSNRKISLSSFH